MIQNRILIVDDDANMRESVCDNLEVAGYSVFQAATGAAALGAVQAEFFGVILMDYNLTDTTGIEVIQKIRTINTESQILMLTAHASLDTAMMAIQESVTDFLPKPIDFDKLKHSIHRAFERLKLLQENASLIADLKKANEGLQRLSQMKSKFMSMSSHDLANALMSLQTNFELLAGTLAPNEDQARRITAISGSIDLIAHLSSDLVDWASIEQGRFRLEPQPVDPAQMLLDLLPGPQARAKRRGIELVSEIQPGLPKISADKRRLGQVLGNLLENAVRHTSKGGRITVKAGLDGGLIHFSVTDTGEGIAAGELQRIFQSFYQGSGQGGRLGLGLAIAKEIVEAHGGKIWVESPGLGKGASFHFTIAKAHKTGA